MIEDFPCDTPIRAAQFAEYRLRGHDVRTAKQAVLILEIGKRFIDHSVMNHVSFTITDTGTIFCLIQYANGKLGSKEGSTWKFEQAYLGDPRIKVGYCYGPYTGPRVNDYDWTHITQFMKDLENTFTGKT